MKILLTLVVLALGASFSEATLLDSFLTRDQDDLIFGGPNEGGHSLVASNFANCVGGERDFEFKQFQNTPEPGPRFIAAHDPLFGGLRIGGYGNETPGSGSGGYAILQYDGLGDEVGNLGRDKSLRNGGSGVPLFNGSDGGIRIWYTNRSTFDVGVTVTLRRLGSTLASTRLLANSLTLNSLSFPFSPSVFGAADSMTIKFEARNLGPFSDDTVNLFYIDTIVPEPCTYLALGGGLAWLLTRRGRKTRKWSQYL